METEKWEGVVHGLGGEGEAAEGARAMTVHEKWLEALLKVQQRVASIDAYSVQEWLALHMAHEADADDKGGKKAYMSRVCRGGVGKATTEDRPTVQQCINNSDQMCRTLKK